MLGADSNCITVVMSARLRAPLAFAFLLWGTGHAAPLLGQRVDLSRGAQTALRATGICTELSCNDAVIVKIDAATTYLGALYGGAFTYLVNGRVAMVGWMGRPHGESPLTPTPAQFNRLAQKVAASALPPTWLKATWTNWNQSVGLDPGATPLVTQKNAVFGGKVKNGGWYTLYIAQPAHAVRLRALINRVEPKNAQAIAGRFVRDLGGPLSPNRDQCPAGTQPLVATLLIDEKTYKVADAYFRARGMPAIGCCGGPPSWALPGLSASNIALETRNPSSSTGGNYPNACVFIDW